MKIIEKIRNQYKSTLLYSYRDLPPELQESIIKYVLIAVLGLIITVASIPAFWSIRITLILFTILLIYTISILVRYMQICHGEYFFLVTTISGKEKAGNRYMIYFSYDNKDYTAIISGKTFQKLQPGYVIKIYVKCSNITSENENSFVLEYPTYIFIIKNGKTVSVNLF